ncbi:MAG: cysteine desulfurase [Planctomycetes bacterium]|nr:cysteine desulfurase [Planctomycetota bacterium]
MLDAPMAVIYLDHAATTPLDPRVREAFSPWLGERFGNPSSRHPYGVAAAEALDQARAELARAFAVRANEVVFTSGATEANNLAVLGQARASRRHGNRVLIGATEHPSVREPAAVLAREGFVVETLALDSDGVVDLADLARRLAPDVVLVAQMLVSNEFGTLHPLRELARTVRTRAPHAKLHVDAVQAVGKVDCALAELGCDSLAVSAHKLHGPQGVGALVIIGKELEPVQVGGGQERGRRSGTENVAGAVGLAAAVRLAEAERERTLAATRAGREAFVARLGELPGARVLAPKKRFVDAILALVVPGAPAEVVMHHLERRGVYVSAGAACQSKKGAQSPALAAIGLAPDEARHVLRISFARTTKRAEAEFAAQALVEVLRELAAVSA